MRLNGRAVWYQQERLHLTHISCKDAMKINSSWAGGVLTKAHESCHVCSSMAKGTIVFKCSMQGNSQPVNRKQALQVGQEAHAVLAASMNISIGGP